MSEKRSRLITRGNKGRERIEQEEQRRKAQSAGKYGPYASGRFFVPVGQEKQIIILDDGPEVFINEHNLKDPKTGKYSLFTPCIRDFDNCPICDNVKESTYVLLLTVLDLTPWEDKDGNEHEFTRRLMVVKPMQQKKFIRRFEKEGTLRGAVFTMTRDNAKDASIGSDIEFEEFEELKAEDWMTSYKDKDGKTHEVDNSQPYVYDEILTEPTYDSLAALIGMESGRNGSVDHAKRDLDDDDLDENEDDAPWDDEEEEAPKPAKRRGRARSAEPEDDEEEEAEESPKRSGRSALRRRRSS